MTRVLTVLPAVPLPATTGLQLRMLEVLQIVRAFGGHSTVLAFETEDDDEGIDPLSTLCEEAIAGGRRVPYETFSVGDRVFHRASGSKIKEFRSTRDGWREPSAGVHRTQSQARPSRGEREQRGDGETRIEAPYAGH